MANHHTHLAPGFTPNDLVSAPANVVVLPCPLGFCLWGRHTASTRCPPSMGTASPCVSRRPLDFILSWGFSLLTRALPGIELQSLRLCAPPVYRILMEFKLSPFSLLSSVPAAVSTFPLSLQLPFGEGAFPIFSTPPPHLHPLSTSKNSCLPSVPSLSPSSPLHSVYLLNSVVQVVQIVVLIFKSVF